MKVSVSEKGVYVAETAGAKLDPPRTVLELPARAGDRWKRELQKDGLEGTATVGGVERVETPAGTFQALRVDWETVDDGATRREFLVRPARWVSQKPVQDG
jgi:hypothetical protein